MKRKAAFLMGLALLASALIPFRAAAQEGVRTPVSHQHLISGNPLILLAGWFNAEYETKLAETTTVGASGGWLDLDDADYTSLSGFLRFYPQGAAFTGFYLGGRFGIHNVDEDNHGSTTAFGLGVDIGYSWLLGPGRSFYVGLGIGATRLLGGDLGDASATIPSLRLVNVGIAF
jgi:hypothetical protein